MFATLNIKQEKFCAEYVKCGNATEAYRLAGYKGSTDDSVRTKASRLLTNGNVKQRIAELSKANTSALIADAKEIAEGLSKLHRTAIENGDILGASKTADILNKMQGTYITKTEITGADGGAIMFGWCKE